MANYFDIVLVADLKSKKNMYGQTKTGRRYKPKAVKDAEDASLMQIPAEFYGLELQHPAVEFFSFIPKKNWALDRDGIFTTGIDILVKFKVFKDDNIRNFNGLVLHHKVLEAAHKKFVFRIYKDGILRITPDSEIEGLR